jgi:hypothetical protein
MIERDSRCYATAGKRAFRWYARADKALQSGDIF